jgi:hypothetical protein
MTRKLNMYPQSNANLNVRMQMRVARTQEPIDLTGYKADMEIRDRKEGPVRLALLSSYLPDDERDGVITLDSSGFITLSLNTNILLNKVKRGSWYYDLVTVDSHGVQSREIEGKFVVDGSTTLIMAENTDPNIQIIGV